MSRVTVIIAFTALLAACHSRSAEDQSSPAALKAADLQRARNEAEEDRIEGERQLAQVRARTRNQAEDKPNK